MQTNKTTHTFRSTARPGPGVFLRGIFFCLVAGLSGYATTSTAPEDDYLDPDLRVQVQKLKADVNRTPTTSDNAPERVGVLWD